MTKKWITRAGDNLTSLQVVRKINRAAGASYTVRVLESTYRIGAVYHNGWMWFQRVA
jgi:hypothetical protein